MRSNRAEELFLAAADLGPAERASYLDAHCADVALRREVEELLACDVGAEECLRGIVERAAQAMERGSERLVIGAWRVGELIGRGGMGNVYLAERVDEAFGQRAAIKILNQRVAGQMRRFLRERNILARLSHPHIAQLFDAGVTPEGQPYLVLEYVEGEPVDEYVVRMKLELRARLELFCDIAGALEHAHRNLVVHRDVKPANILVTKEGVAKLLDFGIAQVQAESEEQPTTVAMTLDYAAPEQVKGESPSPSVDVYALGVLLHKLVTGRTPLELDGMPLEQAVRKLMDAEVRIEASVPTDLRHILARALAKEPGRRYGSVEMLRADVERFVRREPVEARGGDALYRLRRFAARRWLPLSAVALIFVATVVALVLTQRAQVEAERQRAVAEEALQRAEAERQRADAMSVEARRQRDLAEQRATALAAQVSRADRNLASARLNASAVTRMLDQQFVAGGARQAIGTVDEWLKVQTQVVEREKQSAEAVKLLGILEGRKCGYISAENLKAAEGICESSVKHLAPLEGSEQADDWLATSLASSRAMLGRMWAANGRVEEGLQELERAQRSLRPALERNPNDGALRSQMATIGMYKADVLLKAGRAQEAAAGYTLATGEMRRAKGKSFSRPMLMQLAAATTRLARVLETQNRGQARQLYGESLAVYRQLAEAPQSALIDWNEYANALNEVPFVELRQPEVALRFALKAVEATGGKNANALDTLGWAYYRAGRVDEAIATERQALALTPAGAKQLRELIEKALVEFEARTGR